MHEPAIWKIFLDGGPSGDGEWFLMANSDAVEQAYSTWRQQNCVPRFEWHYRDQDGRDFYINFSEMKQVPIVFDHSFAIDQVGSSCIGVGFRTSAAGLMFLFLQVRIIDIKVCFGNSVRCYICAARGM